MTPDFQRKVLAVAASIPHGWCNEAKSLALAKYAWDSKVCVEIGVYAGKSLIAQAIALQEANQGGIIYGIDPWKKEPALEGEMAKADADWWSKLDYHEIHRHAVEAVWRLALDNRVVLLRTTSDMASLLFNASDPLRNIDLLHIDGNHSEQSSMADVERWLPRLSTGGILAMDDTDWPSTRKAVEMIESCCQFLERTAKTPDGSETTFYRKR